MFKSIFNWSGGKDSALALYHVLKDNRYSIARLLTSVNTTYQRVSMHGVRETLLEQQAECLGIPLQKLQLNDQPTMSEYNQLMEATMIGLKKEGFTHSIFGDIFLEDLKKFREDKLSQQGFKAHFPIWKRNTRELVHEFIDLGFKTIVVCIKGELLDKSFAGRVIDQEFLKDLPANVDPCGENGEFHTFVYDGPIFDKPIDFQVGETVYREYKAPKDSDDNCFSSDTDRPNQMGFWFCDLLPC
ncbi:diphthine--ammonia ligase [Fulvivirgaceae bacterium BMA10]|uniref:Diphthine--ammonia ligase n=1 Tax=Splendidivirga corallicola TaxID=3051826 RepID=A0ABT8KUR3_9BACT|nr:diphthine--ammonia ligase [Fulvivirgaceae bacterium BMA10]